MPSITDADEITVARVKAEGGPAGAKGAFDLLESRMPSLRGRKMYGVVYNDEKDVEAYYACVRLDDEHPDDMGFERATIPGGRYARRRVQNWSGHEQEIAGWFEELEEECGEGGLELDTERPGLEFYRSLNELILMVPVK